MAIPLSAIAWSIFNTVLLATAFAIIPVVLSVNNIMPLSLYFSILFIVIAIIGIVIGITAGTLSIYSLGLLAAPFYLALGAAFFFYYYKHRSTKTVFQTEQIKVPVKTKSVIKNN